MSITESAQRVAEWNKAAGHLDGVNVWGDEGYRDRKRAISIIQEELDELETALAEKDPVETLDALCDILFTVFGAAAKAQMIPLLDEAFNEVCRSNDTKLIGQKSSPGVKLGKGKHYEPPRLAEIYHGATV